MEETIWMLFGVLGLIIALGIIGPLLYNQTNSFNEESLSQDLKLLRNQANFLCTTEIGNSMTRDINLYYRSEIYSKEDKICIKKEDYIKCEIINCQIRDYSFDVSSNLAKEFNELSYNCELEVVGRGLLSLDCEK